jgi:hypothetical protein
MAKLARSRRRRQAKRSPDPYEIGSAASATAILGLVACSLQALQLGELVAVRLQGALVAYVAGLCLLDEHPTACAMADKVGISHDRLTRLSRAAGNAATLLVRLLIGLAQSLGHPGWLIIDDVLLPHRRGKHMAGVYWDFDHAEQKPMRGMRVVVLLWTDGWLRLPVAFTVWHKKGSGLRRYRSKNELARLLVRWVLRRGLRPSYVTFDAWYASQQNLRCFSRWGLHWVTRLKKNARLTWQGKELLAKTIGRRLLQGRRPYTFRQLAVQGRSTQLDWGRLRDLTFVVVQHDLDGEKTSRKYLLSNQPLATRQLIERYKNRWVVEVFFRDCKQHLGLSAYQGRTWEGAMGHLTLVFLAAVVSDVLKGKEMTVGEVKKMAQHLIVLHDAQGHPRLAVQTLPDWSDPQLLAKAQRLVKAQLKAVSPLRVPTLKRQAA